MRTFEELWVIDLELVVSQDVNLTERLEALGQVGRAVNVSDSDLDREAADRWFFSQLALFVVPFELDDIIPVNHGVAGLRLKANFHNVVFIGEEFDPIDPV